MLNWALRARLIFKVRYMIREMRYTNGYNLRYHLYRDSIRYPKRNLLHTNFQIHTNLFCSCYSVFFSYFYPDRFKPEKSQRRPVQKMKWSQSRWSRSLAGDLFSCSHHSAGATGLGLNGSLASTQIHSPAPSVGYPNNFSPLTVQNLPLESESRVSSMTIADVSPRIAVKKVCLIFFTSHDLLLPQFIRFYIKTYIGKTFKDKINPRNTLLQAQRLLKYPKSLPKPQICLTSSQKCTLHVPNII